MDFQCKVKYAAFQERIDFVKRVYTVHLCHVVFVSVIVMAVMISKEEDGEWFAFLSYENWLVAVAFIIILLVSVGIVTMKD